MMIKQLLKRRHLPLMRRSLISAGQSAATQKVSLVAAGCAFYAILALFPTITMLISLYGLIYNPHTVQPQMHSLRSFMPPAAFKLISNRITSIVAEPGQGLGISFVVSFLISFWSSSTGTTSVVNAVTMAYAAEDNRSFIRFYLITFAMTIVAIIGAALAIAFLVFVPVALANINLPAQLGFFVSYIGPATMIIFIAGALTLLYRYGPPGSDRIFYAPGAGVATIAWLAASSAFGFYVGHFAAYSAVYGPLATIIGLMMWFYLTAYAVLFGAEINAALDREWRHMYRHKSHEEKPVAPQHAKGTPST